MSLATGSRAAAWAVLGLTVLGVAALLAVPALRIPVMVGALVCNGVVVVLWRHSAERIHRQNAYAGHQALHDPLTELPNRLLFHDRLQQAVTGAARRGTQVPVAVVDLDRFTDINEALGYDCGDVLLHMVAQRLAEALRGSDSVARLGNDEFAVVLQDLDYDRSAVRAGRRIGEAVAGRYELDGVAVEIEVSVGVALFPDDGSDAETLLRKADVALQHAKSSGHLGVELYRPEQDVGPRDRLELVADLHRALERNEILAHFQPKADMHTGEIVGVEALMRWDHPTRGLLYPDTFLSAAAQTSLMHPLTLRMLELSLGQLARWRGDGWPELTIAVNLSTRDFHDPELVSEIQRSLELHGLPASSLELEITETTIMDSDRVAEALAELGALGVGLAVDDYGTGYTSLSWLTDLPVTCLKIDRSFVAGVARSRDEGVIVASTIELGRNLGLTVVAEGVEDCGMWRTLAEMGCDEAQGFGLSRPQPVRELTAWMVSYEPSRWSAGDPETAS
ncbi:MAG: putative bifunctional diguanylate cyclase/phosphodiesterase [Solirubrobacterales bacterium]